MRGIDEEEEIDGAMSWLMADDEVADGVNEYTKRHAVG